MLLEFERKKGVLVRDPHASVMALGAVYTSLDKHREAEKGERRAEELCKMQEKWLCFRARRAATHLVPRRIERGPRKFVNLKP